MDRTHIIAEIKRTAEANGGVALGWRRFEEETGIRYYDWYGQFWAKWGDAVREAGFEANRMNEAYDDDFLAEQLVLLTQRLGRVPTQGDVLIAGKNDQRFPSEKAFRRLGSKPVRAALVIAFCEKKEGLANVAALWKTVILSQKVDVDDIQNATETVGYVYLLKHGSRREYKIGRTYNPLRREGEIAIELPEKLKPIHYIETDDPSGIENYWHTRFSKKRKEGEWFALSADDVRAFMRWKRIY